MPSENWRCMWTEISKIMDKIRLNLKEKEKKLKNKKSKRDDKIYDKIT
ncbi:MAG TPA: hypothetical protein VMZ91_12040 [Candidatus Paceibacterota bacterium]|nr:hypothetical protein [Candidatus Paceibacterota bacterium]